MSGSPAILAIVYNDGDVAASFIADLGYRLRHSGAAVAGVVPYRSATPREGKCTIEVEELASRFVLQLADDMTTHPFGCRIDPEALSEAAALISAALQKAASVVIFNKFGKLEAEGGGLRETIAEAIELGVPAIVGVPRRHIASWRQFTHGLAEEVQVGSQRLYQWLTARKIMIACEEAAESFGGAAIRAAG